MKTVAKAWVSFTGLVLLVVGTELGSDTKWYAYAVAALATAGVWLFPNKEVKE